MLLVHGRKSSRSREREEWLQGSVGSVIHDIQRSRRGLIPQRRTAVVKDEDDRMCETPEPEQQQQQQRWRNTS